MLEWLLGKKETLTRFPDNESAFAHACSPGYALLINAKIPALVIEEGQRGRDGEHWYRLRLASRNRPLDFWGPTLSAAPACPQVGDLVAFRIVRIATELPDDASLVGYIDCRLDPVLNSRKGWQVAESFRPDNLKPELHLG